MRDERFFRAAAAALLLSAMSISGYHRRKAARSAQRSGEEPNPSWREEGLPVAVGLRASGLALLLSVVAYALNPRWMRWSRLDLPAALRLSGAGLGAASLPLAHWVLKTLGDNITPTVSTRKYHRLVTSGPYRRVRHPLYSVGGSLVISLNLLVANWFMWLASVAGFAFLLVRLPKEEEKLIERFGDEYREYAKRTGRFLPRLR